MLIDQLFHVCNIIYSNVITNEKTSLCITLCQTFFFYIYTSFLLTEPSGFVKSVSEIAKTSSSFTVSWNDPDCRQKGGAFLRYDVVVSGFSQNFSTTDRFKQITGLQTYTDYNVQIAYVNNIGAGPLSPMQSFKTGEGCKYLFNIPVLTSCQ